MVKSNSKVVEEVLAGMTPPEIERGKPRKRGRPKGTTNKARMYDRGVIALMSCSTVEEAAAQIGVTRQTVFNWLKDPEFLEKLDEARRMALGQAMIVLSAAAGGAVQTLVNIHNDANQPGSTRVSAANSLLQIINNQIKDERQIREQNERIQSLKRALDEAVGLDGERSQPALASTSED
jgi:hypothetical protein